MSIADYLRALSRRWRIVLVTVLLGGLLGAVYVIAVPERYEATAQVFVTADGDDDATTAYSGLLFLQERVKSYAGALTSPLLLNPVIDDLRLDMNAAKLADAVEVTVPLDTAVLTITVTNEDPKLAAAIAERLGEQFNRSLPELENIPADVIPVSAGVLGAAVVSDDPIRPSPVRDVGIALALSALVGVALALLREMNDTVVRDEAAVRALTDATVVGRVPPPRSGGEAVPVIQRGDTSPRTQGYRAVRASLAMVTDVHPRSLLVTSAVAGEGKSALAAHLALVTAETGLRVCLVEADLRHPELLALFGLDEAVGLTEVLNGDATLDEVLQPHTGLGVTLLGAGTLPDNPTELLGGPRMATVLRELEDRYDLVVLDSTSMLAVADAPVLSRLADEVVLVVGVGRSRMDQLAETLGSLDRVGATVRGIVLDEGALGSQRATRRLGLHRTQAPVVGPQAVSR